MSIIVTTASGRYPILALKLTSKDQHVYSITTQICPFFKGLISLRPPPGLSIRDLRIATHIRIILGVKAVFVELPPFERHRAGYLDDDAFGKLQSLLMLNPEVGDAIPGTGGLRKLRFADERRGKGKRGGLRVIYYWWDTGSQFWLFTVYDKDEMNDLTPSQCKALKEMIKKELKLRRKR